MRDVICGIVDRADFLEVQAGYAPNIVVGFGRIAGPDDRHHRQPAVGPLRRARHQRLRSRPAGSSASATPSTSRWSRSSTCPGFLPGVQQEYGGIIRHGAKMLFAYSAATVPKIQVILRKSYGGAHLAMCSQGPGRRPRLRLADRRGRRDGRRGGRRDRLPQGDGGRRGQGRAPRRADRAVPRDVLDPVRRGRPPAGRRHHRAGRHARGTWPRPWNTCRPSAITGRRRSTA